MNSELHKLYKCANDILDDLERYASKCGPGPDKRLEALKAAISEYEQRNTSAENACGAIYRAG